MKKKIAISAFVALLLSVSNYSFSFDGCVECTAGSSECYRVIVGNTTHIFHGKAVACEN